MISQRIALVSRMFRPEPAAAAIQLGVLYDTLSEAGHDVIVLTSRSPVKEAERDPNVRRWPVLRDSQGAVRGYLQYASFDLPLLLRILFGRKRDLIIAHPPPTTGFVVRIACALRRIPYWYYADDLLTHAVEGAGAPKILVSFVRFLERFSLRGAERVLTISDSVRDEIVKAFGFAEKIEVVGTGIDTKVFTPEGPVKRPVDRYFLYSGTFSALHGATVFTEAFRTIAPQYPEVHLLFYGQGTDREAIASAAAEPDSRIELHPLVPGEQIAEIMRGAVAGLASVRPGKGYDFAYTTKAFAMNAVGLPVLYSGVGPVKDMIIEHGLGMVCEWDVEQVAEAMKQLLDQDQPQDRFRIASWARQNWSFEAVALRIINLIRL